MNEMNERDDAPGFSAEERKALASWQVPDAPEGLAERVLARAAASRPSPRSRGDGRTVRLVALAAALVLAIGGGAWWLTRGEAVVGSLRTAVRTSQALGARGVAVLEPGAALAWSVSRDGTAVIEQGGGAVFYRVDRGGEFTVRVPEGEVRVRGTCFEVEVKDMAAWVPALGGAAVGAAVSALVVVTVYEGRVEVARGGEVRVVEPGERAVLGDGVRVEPGRPARAADEDGATPEKVAPSGVDKASAARTDGAAAGTPAAAAELAQLRRENETLRAELVKQRARAAEADELRDAHRSYGLSQAELDRMAERCELRWDTIPYRLGDPPRVPGDDAEAFGLGAAQVAALDTLLAAENTRLVEAIRAAYLEVTGDEPAAVQAVAPNALFSEIEDKTPIDERRRIFKQLAEERARGVAVDLSAERLATMTPAERLFRVITSSGDRLEAALAKEVGPEQARQMRDAHNGFGNVHRSSYGCPEETE